MQIHWYFIEISIEFQLDFDWKFIVISTGCPLDFHCNFNTVSTGLQMFFRFILHWNFQLNFQLDFRMMSIRIIEISTGLPMDFNWYFIEISTGFPMGIHWNFFEISIELQLDFQCASTWPASSQKFPRTSRTKLTKKKPVYVSGPAMAKHQKQLWSDPLWDCHSLWLWDEIQYFLSFNHSAGSPCPGWRRSTPPWWPFGWDSTTQAVPMAQELSCLASSHTQLFRREI